MNPIQYDILIIGGSYAGLSAAMALGRSLRNVLVIDGGMPCNRQTPYSHNFITHDGAKPKAIAEEAKKQILKYKTVSFKEGIAVGGKRIENGFQITLDSGELFESQKLIFATGVKDIMPNIPGFSECWGISVIHCPYCHGYEFKGNKTGILLNGDMAYHLLPLVKNLSEKVFLLTNGKAEFSIEQLDKIRKNQIQIIEKPISQISHEKGIIKAVVFEDLTTLELEALYAKPAFEQHCKIPEELGCKQTESGHIVVSPLQKTSVDGIYACGDNATPMRSVSYAVATGNIAGAMINHELASENF